MKSPKIGLSSTIVITYHNRPADDTQIAGKGDLFVFDVDLSDTVVAGSHVAEISGVSAGVFGSTVFLSVGVEVRSSADAPCNR